MHFRRPSSANDTTRADDRCFRQVFWLSGAVYTDVQAFLLTDLPALHLTSMMMPVQWSTGFRPRLQRRVRSCFPQDSLLAHAHIAAWEPEADREYRDRARTLSTGRQRGHEPRAASRYAATSSVISSKGWRRTRCGRASSAARSMSSGSTLLRPSYAATVRAAFTVTMSPR